MSVHAVQEWSTRQDKPLQHLAKLAQRVGGGDKIITVYSDPTAAVFGGFGAKPPIFTAAVNIAPVYSLDGGGRENSAQARDYRVCQDVGWSDIEQPTGSSRALAVDQLAQC